MIPTMAKSERKPKSTDKVNKKATADVPEGKSARTLRLPDRVWALLEELAEQHMTDVTDEIRQAIRERLERAGKWPPGKSTAQS